MASRECAKRRWCLCVVSPPSMVLFLQSMPTLWAPDLLAGMEGMDPGPEPGPLAQQRASGQDFQMHGSVGKTRWEGGEGQRGCARRLKDNPGMEAGRTPARSARAGGCLWERCITPLSDLSTLE